MPVRFRRIFSLLLIACGLVLILRPVAAQPSSPAVLINEFMPRPSSGAEWVELFNPNPYDVDIGNWKIAYVSFFPALIAFDMPANRRKVQMWVQCGS